MTMVVFTSTTSGMGWPSSPSAAGSASSTRTSGLTGGPRCSSGLGAA
ncbi:MAG TPA: hypothetical protein VKM55_19105 [Candidatus Lokiarchaeia archaeon]|nr:hypothetical protein [Candidatus Lokiarchaeia archaeon]